MENKKYFQILTPSAHMPSNCWGRYSHVYVIETNGCLLKQAHPKHKPFVKTLFCAERQFHGTTDRCAFYQALAEAEVVAQRLEQDGWTRVT